MNLFDSIRDTITDTSKTVMKKAKDVSELTRLTNKITAEEREIQNAYLSIGKRYYEQPIGQVSEEFEIDFYRIHEAEAKIKELKEQIKSLKGRSSCRHCGTYADSGSVYCGKCGHKMADEQPPETKDEDDRTVVPDSLFDE